MTIHYAAAKLTLATGGDLYQGTLQTIHRELTEQRQSPLLRGLGSAFEWLTGMKLVSKSGLELFEYVLRRGVAAGGTDMADYLEAEIMDHIFRGTTIFSAPANIYVALFTADPGETGSHTNEVSGTGTDYAREAVSTSGGWSGSAGSTDNVAAVDFGTASGSWGTVTHVALTDNATRATGNHFFNGPLTASKAVGSGDSFQFAAGNLDVAVD